MGELTINNSDVNNLTFTAAETLITKFAKISMFYLQDNEQTLSLFTHLSVSVPLSAENTFSKHVV